MCITLLAAQGVSGWGGGLQVAEIEIWTVTVNILH